MSVAERQIKEILGLGGGSHHSPAVPPEVLARQARLLFGGQAGYRIGKYGTAGLEMLFKYLGDVLGIPVIKEWARACGLGTTGLVTLLAEYMVEHPTARLFVFGSAFFVITELIDVAEAFITKAMAKSEKK